MSDEYASEEGAWGDYGNGSEGSLVVQPCLSIETFCQQPRGTGFVRLVAVWCLLFVSPAMAQTYYQASLGGGPGHQLRIIINSCGNPQVVVSSNAVGQLYAFGPTYTQLPLIQKNGQWIPNGATVFSGGERYT